MNQPLSLDLYHGLWGAMIAKALVELSIPDLIDDNQGKTVHELAQKTGSIPTKLFRLLRGAASFQFLRAERFEGLETVFMASEQTLSMRVGHPAYYLIKHLVSSQAVLVWDQLSDHLSHPESGFQMVVGTTLWNYLEEHPQQQDIFTGAMTVLSAPINPLIVQTYANWSGTIADLGGGQGTLIHSILRTYPNTLGIIFDREQGLTQTREQIRQDTLLAARCTCVAGSFLEIVPSADIYVLKNVLHNWPDHAVLRILETIHRATLPTSRILIAEMLIPETAPSKAICGLDLLMMQENGGAQRTAIEFATLLTQAGFALEHIYPVGKSPYSLLEAAPI